MLAQYQNGNVFVSLDRDGSKSLSWPDGETPDPTHPVSLDLCITHKCDGGCAWCFESSTPKGLHAPKERIFHRLDGLPPGTEIAIGGGDPFSHPDFTDVLTHMRDRGWVANVTVNAIHVSRHAETIASYREAKLLYGLGISYRPELSIIPWSDYEKAIDDNTVLHVIAGLHDPRRLMRLPASLKILILGYKTYGFGVKFAERTDVIDRINKLRFRMPMLAQHFKLISFDNLAIRQLGVQNAIAEETFKAHFMGHDGSFTMYVNAVDDVYGLSSTAMRFPFGESERLSDAFRKVKIAARHE